MKTGSLEVVENETKTKEELGNPWQVMLFNDEVHSIDEVILQIQKATGYSLERATKITLQVHQNGKALVYVGDKPECEKVANILKQIQLLVQIERT